MKNTEKLELAILRLNNLQGEDAQEAARLLREFIIDNIKEPPGQLSVRLFTAKGADAKVRPALGFVCHDEETKCAVATDAHALFTNRSEYIPTKGNHLRDIYGRTVDLQCRYPNWQAIIPHDTEPMTIRPDLPGILKQAIAEAKMNGRGKDCCLVLVDEIHWMTTRNVEFIIKAGLDGWTSQKEHKNGHATPASALFKQWDGKQLMLMPYKNYDASEENCKRGFMLVQHKHTNK